MMDRYKAMLNALKRLLIGRSRSFGTLSSLEAYKQWAAVYPPYAHNPLMQTEEAAMLAMMPNLRNRTIVDLACGTGRYGLLALQQGAGQVIGIDNSFAMLSAGQNAESGLVQFALTTTEAISLQSSSIDVVLCGLAIGHLPRLLPTLKEIARVLNSHGEALISDFHPFLFLTGRRRTFNVNGSTYAVEHYAHLYADMDAAVKQVGLKIEKVAEPKMMIDDVLLPALIIYHLRK
jgi:malonyl-CoA O-methyltransferase